MPRKLWAGEKRRKHPQSFTRSVLVWIENCRLLGHLLENAASFSKRVLGMNSRSGSCSGLSRNMPCGINERIPKSVRGWLHGYVRATMGVDILIPEDLENHARVIAALSELEEPRSVRPDATGSRRKRRCEGCRRSGSGREYSRLESELCRCDWHIAKGDNRRRGSSLRRFTNFDQEQKH